MQKSSTADWIWCVMCIELKRKADGTLEAGPLSKAMCVEKKCTDLIVLGLPFKSSEDDLKQYFSQFGDLVLVQVQSLSLSCFVTFVFLTVMLYRICDSDGDVYSVSYCLSSWCVVKYFVQCFSWKHTVVLWNCFKMHMVLLVVNSLHFRYHLHNQLVKICNAVRQVWYSMVCMLRKPFLKTRFKLQSGEVSCLRFRWKVIAHR